MAFLLDVKHPQLLSELNVLYIIQGLEYWGWVDVEVYGGGSIVMRYVEKNQE
jgi:hypothetical protein